MTKIEQVFGRGVDSIGACAYFDAPIDNVEICYACGEDRLRCTCMEFHSRKADIEHKQRERRMIDRIFPMFKGVARG